MLDFLFFFYDHLLLFVVTRVAVNHKAVTEGDVLNKIVLKYAPDKIDAGGRGKLPITMNETEYFKLL